MNGVKWPIVSLQRCHTIRKVLNLAYNDLLGYNYCSSSEFHGIHAGREVLKVLVYINIYADGTPGPATKGAFDPRTKISKNETNKMSHINTNNVLSDISRPLY